MNLPAGWKKIPAVLLLVSACATAVVVVADEPAAGAAPSSCGGLKWTPHRPTRLADASAAGSAPATAGTSSTTAAAVPPAPEAPVPPPTSEPSPPPPRLASNPAAMRPAPGYGPRPPATVRPDLPSTPFSLPPLKLPAMPSIFGRSPQGEASRPMLASGEYQPPRIHGGHAPQLPDAPAFGGRPAARPSRVAMNVDELPSVMSKAPNPTPAPSSATGSKAPSGPKAASPEFSAEQLPEMGGPIEFGPTGEVMTMDQHAPSDGMWMGGYPDAMCHDPYADACGPEDECGFLPCCQPTGRVCAWLRQFGRPYYGWRWYRDFTASAGVTGFQTPADMGIAGNFGTNEYANFGMPFWNAFGIGWQLGIRGVQTHFQQTSIEGLGDEPFSSGTRDQVFVTTGFFTRAFEGRGLQFGAVWDYLRDNWYDNVDLGQLRGEISYVWHAHEIGFWAASNYDTTPFTSRRISGNASTIDLYAAFYRLHFGDANEWKVWGGSTDNGDGLIGTLIRAPMTKSLALEGTFTYLIPKDTNTYPLGTDAEGDQLSITTSDAAWNISMNVVFYPACRSRRGLASPYRPLFEVADNGSMIRSLEGLYPTP